MLACAQVIVCFAGVRLFIVLGFVFLLRKELDLYFCVSVPKLGHKILSTVD